jgi:hypothetical protein
MAGGVEVFGGVLVLGLIAAAHVATSQTQAQMYPRIADFQTFFTAIATRSDLADRREMCTGLRHTALFSRLGKVTKVHPVHIGASAVAGPPREVKDFCTLT